MESNLGSDWRSTSHQDKENTLRASSALHSQLSESVTTLITTDDEEDQDDLFSQHSSYEYDAALQHRKEQPPKDPRRKARYNVLSRLFFL